MKRFFLAAIFLVATITSAQVDTNIIFSEIMFNPVSGDNEFIELYNSNPVLAIDLTGYKIRYYNSTPDNLTDAGNGLILQPKSFAVIFENDYDIINGRYSLLVPPEALILKIGDNSFGSSGMANTTGRQLKFISSAGDTTSSYTYTANNTSGYSDEKIILNNNNTATNWSNSLTLDGTPGFRNSVSPLQFNLAVDGLSFEPVSPHQGDDLILSAKIKNKGSITAAAYSVIFYNDSNFDSIPAQTEIINTTDLFNLNNGDSVIVQTTINNVAQGSYNFIVKIIYPPDEDTLDNSINKSIVVYPPPIGANEIIINEIMYAPPAGQPEWIELLNRSLNPINLNNFKLSDNNSTVTITQTDNIILPGEFVILCRDSSIKSYYNFSCKLITFSLQSLNNTGDAVVLKDASGIVIDSLYYYPGWGGSGVSLERISAEESSTTSNNWGSCVSLSKATPGRINSITKKNNDLLLALFKPVIKYIQNGSPALFEIKIKNIGILTANNFSFNLFVDVNYDSIPQPAELITSKTFFSLLPDDSIITSVSSAPLVPGIYNFISSINYVDDEDTTNNISFAYVSVVTINEVRSDIVINEIMHSPIGGEPEWIELFNRSTKTINLKNYAVADNSDTTSIITDEIVLLPGEYFLIADDSTINNFYNLTAKRIYKNFPSLNNSGDKIILLDSLSRVIDSTQYISAWGGANGKSLERIFSEGSSTDSANWKSTKRKTGGTPGSINTVSPKQYDVETAKIIFSPHLPVYGDNVQIQAQIKNNGSEQANFSLQLFSDTNLDSLPDTFLESITNNILQPGDSSIYQFVYNVDSIQTPHGFFVSALFAEDEDTTNNFAFAIASPGSGYNSIVINEIMYKPAGEPEWVELYNTSDKSINLKSWKIKDASSSPGVTIKNDVTILSGSFLIIARDSSIFSAHRIIPSNILFVNIPALNNDDDAVVLQDDRGAAIDSVYYFDNWSSRLFTSLERKSVAEFSNLHSNWGSSLDLEYSTPGRINSITIKNKDLACTAISSMPQFPATGDDVSIKVQLKNFGTMNAENFKVTFLIDEDMDGTFENIFEEKDNLSLPQNDSIVISTDSKIKIIDNLNCAVRVQYEGDEDTLNNFAVHKISAGYKQRTVLISEFMYNPAKDYPEWVEFFNAGSDTINLFNWMISDLLTTPKKDFITTQAVPIAPDEYFIVTVDSSFKHLYPGVNCKIFTSSFGSLGNTSDGICLYDFRNAVIDSIKYSSKWGGEKGISIERISFDTETNDSTNWITSLNINGSTPGLQNSANTAAAYINGDVLINEIMYEPGIDNCEYIELYNSTSDTVNIGGWKMFAGDDIYKISSTPLLLPPKQYFTFAADSIINSKYQVEVSPLSIANETDFGLSASGEVLIVKDLFSNVIDSIFYLPNWHNKNFVVTKNRSLERISFGNNSNDPANWSTCVDDVGGTPGKENSIYAGAVSAATGIAVAPNPFSPDNDGFEDHTIISYSLNQVIMQARIKIFDSKGRLVRTLQNNFATGSKGSIIFDGRDDSGNAIRMGIYIVFMEALNENNGVVQTLKTIVVVARKLN
ncbi:MAG: lamin tail domain-containing protein [Ignavibacteriaceae bacterium]|nr:lamin tail domain-containing protein [Ignavibacteriaceae bacterium]